MIPTYHGFIIKKINGNFAIMKKYFFFFVFFAMNLHLFSQCPAGLQINMSPQNPVCKGTAVTFTATTNAGGISSYIWVVNGDTLGTGTSVVTSVNGAHVEVYAISDTCNFDTLTNDDYIINTDLVADYNVIVIECNQPVADIEIFGITGSPIGNEPYTWELITGGSLSQQDLYPDVPISNYPLVITDAQGCTDTTWINMATIVCPPPSPTEIITPNEDGINDMWVIRNIQFYPNNEVFIFDRWGQRVYHKDEYDNLDGWKAKYVGVDMPVSTYYYVLKIKLEKSDDIVFKGPISVFR